MFHTDEQVDWDSGIITTTWLEKLILPCNTVEIGQSAFAYSIHLTEIQFNESLKKIGKASFTYCNRLATDPFILPPNLEFLGYQAFYGCHSLAGEVILPQSLKIIDGAAFYHTEISRIEIPETVEYLGDFAFYGCNLKEIDLPDNCHLDTRGCQFWGNFELERVHLPANCTQIPEFIFESCIKLNEVNLPDGITHIWECAFDQCISLNSFSTLILPEGLHAIGANAFSSNPIKEIHFPSSIFHIGSSAFYDCRDITRIYCKAQTAPECEPDEAGRSPFDGVNHNIDVYVPIGTKNDYMSSFGWNYLTNFIETQDFPHSGIEDVLTDDARRDIPMYYDINGRKVESRIPGNIYICNGKKVLCK